jgi:hypothetical protein
VQMLQDDYNGALNGTGSRTVAEVLASYQGTQVIFNLPLQRALERLIKRQGDRFPP